MDELQTIKILFSILGLFIVFNFLASVVLKLRVNKRTWIIDYMIGYWGTLIVVFCLLLMSQKGYFKITGAFATNFVPILIACSLGLRSINKKLNFKFYITVFCLGLGSSFLMAHQASIPFSLKVLPLSLAMALPLVKTFYEIFRSKVAGDVENVIAFNLLIGILPIATWTIYRMVPGTQIWGWVFPFIIYISFAISSISYAIVDMQRNEKRELRRLVAERTKKYEAERQKNEQLLKVISHDIANPLMIVSLYSDKLLKRSEDVKVRQSALKISESADYIRDILAHTREVQKSGAINFDNIGIEEVDVAKCISTSMRIFKSRLSEKDLEIEFVNELPRDISIMANETAFTHSVVSNLISNAIKFSYKGSKIALKCSYSEEDKDVVIEVSDNGCGMNEPKVTTLFDSQKNYSTSGTDDESGTGYGLPIVKNYIDHFNGQIEVFSSQAPENHGTTFQIKFQAAPKFVGSFIQ